MAPRPHHRSLARLPYLEAAAAAALAIGLVLGDQFGPTAGLDGRRLCLGLGLAIWLLAKGANSKMPAINGSQFALGTIGVIGWIGLIAAPDLLLAGTRLADMCLLAASYGIARCALLRHGPQPLMGLLARAGFVASALGLASLWIRFPGQIDPGAGSLGTRNLSASFCAMCLTPAIVLGRSRAGWLQVGGIASYLALSGNRLGLLAGMVGAGAVVLGLAADRVGGRKGLAALFATGVCLAAAGVVSIVPDRASTSVNERLHLAQVTLDQLPDSGLVGQGPGSWRITYPLHAAGKEPISWSERYDRRPNDDVTAIAARQPAHAHQDFLELTHDFGLIGLACLLFALVRGFWPPAKGARRSPEQRAALGGLLAFCTLAMGFFPLAEPLCLFALGSLLALAGPLPGATGPRRWSVATLVPLLAIVALSLVNLGLGRALASSRSAAESGDYKASREALTSPRWDFESARYRAWLDSIAGLHESALQHAQAAHSLRPHHPGALNDLGLVLGQLGRIGEAEDLLREAHRLVPQDPEVALNLGQLLMDRLEDQLEAVGPAPGDLAEAAGLFRVAVDGNANLVPGWRGLARCAALAGDRAEALRLHEESRAAALRCELAASASSELP